MVGCWSRGMCSSPDHGRVRGKKAKCWSWTWSCEYGQVEWAALHRGSCITGPVWLGTIAQHPPAPTSTHQHCCQAASKAPVLAGPAQELGLGGGGCRELLDCFHSVELAGGDLEGWHVRLTKMPAPGPPLAPDLASIFTNSLAPALFLLWPRVSRELVSPVIEHAIPSMPSRVGFCLLKSSLELEATDVATPST